DFRVIQIPDIIRLLPGNTSLDQVFSGNAYGSGLPEDLFEPPYYNPPNVYEVLKSTPIDQFRNIILPRMQAQMLAKGVYEDYEDILKDPDSMKQFIKLTVRVDGAGEVVRSVGEQRVRVYYSFNRNNATPLVSGPEQLIFPTASVDPANMFW